jgi:hydroxymethylbilane synthase
MRTFTVGTRGSALALWQTRHVTSLVTPHGASVAERVITTQGDVNLTERLQGNIEKGFFTQELEAALHDKLVDWAVHSLKDLPTRMPRGLVLGAVLERAPACDLLLIHKDAYLDASEGLPLKAGARVGSSSLRRENLLKRFAPAALSVPLRGNVPTRVEKLRQGQFGAILLAEAGVMRLKLELEGLMVFRLNPRRWICAPGQGAVAVQCREDDAEVRALLSKLDHPSTHRATTLEREFLKVLEGGCTTPFGAYVEGERASLGLATPQGWQNSYLDLPRASLPAAELAAWMQVQLDQLSHQNTKEDLNDWLARRV